MSYPILALRSHREDTVLSGHPWIFSGALRQPIPAHAPGTIVDIHDNHDHFVARGYYNAQTDIAVRILTRDPAEQIDLELFHHRIQRATDLRASLATHPSITAYRLINSEGDLLPGLIVDRYADILVVQISTAGMELLEDQIIAALQAVMQPRGILIRNDVASRQREGLERQQPRVVFGEVPPTVDVVEHDIHFTVDVWKGQKTGMFLDQRDKRHALQRFTQGKTVLNTFSYTGGFGIAALQAGAVHVVNVDQSGPVIAMAKHLMTANGFNPDEHEFLVGDAFPYLEQWVEERRQFDVVVLDPPAFAKSAKDKPNALRAYRRLNLLGLQVLRPGGIMLTCSCSGTVSLEEFRGTVADAGASARRSVQVLESIEHGIDHPTLLSMYESRYLKALFVRG